MVGSLHDKAKGILCTRRYCIGQGLLNDKQGDLAFITIGFDNWKKALQRFDQHTKSSLHKEAVLKVDFLKQANVLAQLDGQHKRDQHFAFELLPHAVSV